MSNHCFETSPKKERTVRFLPIRSLFLFAGESAKRAARSRCYCAGKNSVSLLFRLPFVKAGVKGVKILAVQPVSQDAQPFAEALVVHHFPRPQELDGVPHVRVVGVAQDVVVGEAGFLLRCQVFVQIRNGVAGHGECLRGEGSAAGSLGIDPGGVIDEIGLQPGFFDLLRRQVAGQLVHNGAHHFKMGQLFRTHVRQNGLELRTGHAVPLAQVPQGGADFSVGASILYNVIKNSRERKARGSGFRFWYDGTEHYRRAKQWVKL